MTDTEKQQAEIKFKKAIWKACGCNEDEYSKTDMLQFFTYWSQWKGKKMLFQRQPAFEITKRFATFFKSNPKRYAKQHENKGYTLDELRKL